jgi:hypothetical protein
MKRILKKAMILVAMATMLLMNPITLLASTGNDSLLGVGIADAMTKGIGDMATEIMLIIGAILPTVLMIVGAVIAIRKGIGLIRSMVA